MDMFDLAGTLFGNRRDQVAQGSTLTATGSRASADGIAGIVIDADVTPAEGTGDEDVDQTIIDLPTSPDVAEGDEVIVTLVGDGPLKTPIVTANPGSGDRQQAQINSAVELAETAEQVAQATGQHFWPDTDGVHVTEVTQAEWGDSTSPNYHSGANVLLNAFGQLFRDGLNNILAIVSGTTPGVAIYDGQGNAADNILAEFTSDHVRVGGNVPIGDATTGGEASVEFFDQTSTHASSMDASTYIDEQAAGGGYGAYYDMRNEVGITTSLDDDGRVVDTNSNGTASMQLTQEMSYGITAADEQHNEVIAALVADASYSNGTAASHAAIRATASTTGSSHLSHAELIGDTIGIGTDEGSIDYYTTGRVNSTLMQWWETLGYAGSGGATFRLPYTGTWLLVTAHNSTAGANSIWILRPSGNTAFKMCGGSSITVTVSGTSVTVKSTGGTVVVYASWLG